MTALSESLALNVAVLTVSDNLYGRYQETEYFHFLFPFLRAAASEREL